MPRQARQRGTSGIYHVMLRGVNRQNIFEDDEDRFKFLSILGFYKRISQFELYGYCLMGNHIHLLLREINESVSDIIKRISSSYVLWYNQKYERCGHLFQERFKSECVDSVDYFLTVLRYIHQNPVKAGIANTIAEFKWTSFTEYYGASKIIDTKYALGLFSDIQDEVIVKEQFVKFLIADNEDACLDYHEKIKLSDQAVLHYLKQLGVSTSSDLQHLEKRTRDKILNKMKQIDGISIRQLARITGISKSLIDRI